MRGFKESVFFTLTMLIFPASSEAYLKKNLHNLSSNEHDQELVQKPVIDELIVKLKTPEPLEFTGKGGSLFGKSFIPNPFLAQILGKNVSRALRSIHFPILGPSSWKAVNPRLGKIKFQSKFSLEQAKEILERSPLVEYAEANVRFQLFKPVGPVGKKPGKKGIAPAKDPAIKNPGKTKGKNTTDPLMNEVYGISKVKADQAWKHSKGNRKIIVAVIDSGVDYNHKDLINNIWRNPTPDTNGVDTNKDGFLKDRVGWDFANDDALPFDDNGHGTHCSGVIGAEGGNAIGISGVNQKVSIMALKFTDENGSGSLAGSVGAIDYAINHGADVISASWGAPMPDAPKSLIEAIERAKKAGILFVAAAGNGDLFGYPMDTDVDPVYPAGIELDNIISVGATDSSDALGSFSNYGEKTVDLSAPGVGIYSSIPGDKYEKLSGTSMATPHVAGAIALIKSKHGNYNWKKIKKALLDSVDPVKELKGKTVSGGRLNVLRAIQ